MIYLRNDGYVGRSLDLYGEFSEGEVACWRQYVEPGMLVLDVGANIGAHTVALARLVGPLGRVLAFEPIPYLYHLLGGNVAVNGLTYVRTFNVALGREHGSVRVPPIDFTQDDNYGGLSLGDWTYGDLVPQMTVDEMQLPACHFVKIDVEGMERDVLLGARETIAKYRPVLYVENDRGERSAALLLTLATLGYRMTYHTPPLYNPQNVHGASANVFPGIVSLNMLCVPEEDMQGKDYEDRAE